MHECLRYFLKHVQCFSFKFQHCPIFIELFTISPLQCWNRSRYLKNWVLLHPRPVGRPLREQVNLNEIMNLEKKYQDAVLLIINENLPIIPKEYALISWDFNRPGLWLTKEPIYSYNQFFRSVWYGDEYSPYEKEKEIPHYSRNIFFKQFMQIKQ